MDSHFESASLSFSSVSFNRSSSPASSTVSCFCFSFKYWVILIDLCWGNHDMSSASSSWLMYDSVPLRALASFC